jgi:hypothetical protein
MPASLLIGRFLEETEISEELREMDVFTDPISFKELAEVVKTLPNLRFKPDKKIPPAVNFRFEVIEVFLLKGATDLPIDKDDWYGIFHWDEVDGTISFNGRTTDQSPTDTIWQIATQIANLTKATITDDGCIVYVGKFD